MRAMNVWEQLEFRDNAPNAQPLYVDAAGRILRFALRPGQRIEEHSVPGSPVYILVLRGRGVFSGADGEGKTFGPESLLVFDPGELHAVRALDEELVFLAFLHGAPDARTGRVGGLMGN